MSKIEHVNAEVINANLATPLLKKSGAPNPGINLFDRLYYIGRNIYYDEPEETDQDLHFVKVPDVIRNDETYSVYGFSIPNPVRLRIMVHRGETDTLPRSLRRFAEDLRSVSNNHGVTIELVEPTVRISDRATYDGFDFGVEWSVEGIARCAQFDQELKIIAAGIKGHAVHAGSKAVGEAAISFLS